MRPKSKEEVQLDLMPIEEALRGCVESALREFIEVHKEHRAHWSARTQSSVLHDLMIKHVRARFGAENVNAKARQAGNLSFLDVNGKYVIRFKKLDRNLRSSNIPTQSVMKFLHQQPCLPGIDPPTNLMVGYQPQDAELGSSKVFVVCPDGSSIAWSWELTKTAEVIDFPAPKPAPSRTPDRRVRPKGKRDDKKKGEGDDGDT